MAYYDANTKRVKARMHIEYFDMTQMHIDKTEGAVIGGLMNLRQNQE